jgi:hypothetical protein
LHYFGFRKNNFLQNKVVSLASNPKPGGPSHSCIYALQRQGGAVIPPGTGFTFARLLRLSRLRLIYLTR